MIFLIIFFEEWGSDDYKWAFVEAQGKSGGILYIWYINFIKDESVSKGTRWLWFIGFIQD